MTERYKDHLEGAKYGKDTYLYRAMRKYGVGNFTLELVEECTDSDAGIRETYWITTLGTLIPIGYNMTLGGQGGDTSLSPKYITSIKEYHSRKSKTEYATCGFREKTHTVTSKEKLSKSKKDRWASLTEEQKTAHSCSVSGSKNGMFGKVPKNAKKIIVDDIEYRSIAEAASALGISVYKVAKRGKYVG